MSDCAYRHCELCPRRCGVNRQTGETGVCGETAECRVAHSGAHFGEEPPISGQRGSGTIFFSGCASRCFFCQNYQISVEHRGRVVIEADLRGLADTLLAQRVHNLNFVTPDHFWPHVQRLVAALHRDGCTTPMLYNYSGYQLPELVAAVAATMDIALPDFKFAQPALAAACMNAPDYPEVALSALRRMVAAKGFLTPWDPEGTRPAERGVMVRHLVLPGEVENSLAVLRLLHREFGPALPLSVMSQFTPTEVCTQRQRFTRGVTAEEYGSVCELVEELGFESVFIQEVSEATDFLPDFTRDKPFAGNPGG